MIPNIKVVAHNSIEDNIDFHINASSTRESQFVADADTKLIVTTTDLAQDVHSMDGVSGIKNVQIEIQKDGTKVYNFVKDYPVYNPTGTKYDADKKEFDITKTPDSTR